jgi:exodeoxyribonuclease VII small subunit
MPKTERPSFEEALHRLESIVEKLENPDVTLEDSIKLYEEGMKLSRYCSQTLEDAVLRIEKINTGPETDADSESSD